MRPRRTRARAQVDEEGKGVLEPGEAVHMLCFLKNEVGRGLVPQARQRATTKEVERTVVCVQREEPGNQDMTRCLSRLSLGSPSGAWGLGTCVLHSFTECHSCLEEDLWRASTFQNVDDGLDVGPCFRNMYGFVR